LNYSFGPFTTIGDYFQFALHFLLFHNTQYKRIITLPLDVPNISLLFGENSYKSLSRKKRLKKKDLPDTGWINRETESLWRLY
jgi:hypothetical protein